MTTPTSSQINPLLCSSRKRGISYHSETQLTASSRNVSTSSVDSGFCCDGYEDDATRDDVTGGDPFSRVRAPATTHATTHATTTAADEDDNTFGSAESRHLKPKLKRARNKCKVLLYIIGDDDTGMNSMIEVRNSLVLLLFFILFTYQCRSCTRIIDIYVYMYVFFKIYIFVCVF